MATFHFTAFVSVAGMDLLLWLYSIQLKVFNCTEISSCKVSKYSLSDHNLFISSRIINQILSLKCYPTKPIIVGEMIGTPYSLSGQM